MTPRKTALVGVVGVLVGASALLSTLDFAHATPRFFYVAMFSCGFDPPGAFQRLIPGQYATSIAIHNPSSSQITFRKKVALSFPPAEQAPGQVSRTLQDVLAPGQSLQVDCQEIPAQFTFPQGPPAAPYVLGHLTIESARRVAVTATYTVGEASEPAPGGLRGVRGMTVVAIPEIRADD